MIYLDTSVALAHLLAEDRQPPAKIWNEVLISSRLLEYEIWTRIHALKLARSHAEEVRSLLGRIALVELSPPVLTRVLEPFPRPVRTLDALHLASMRLSQQARSNRSARKLRRSIDRRCPCPAVYSLRFLSACASLRQNRQSEIQNFFCRLSAHGYLIILSARYSTDCGIVSPICLAVFKLITSSNFIGCSTGGFLLLIPHAHA